MLDCIVSDVPRPAIVADGDDFTLVLPMEYAEVASAIAGLVSAIPTSAADAGDGRERGAA